MIKISKIQVVSWSDKYIYIIHTCIYIGMHKYIQTKTETVFRGNYTNENVWAKWLIVKKIDKSTLSLQVLFHLGATDWCVTLGLYCVCVLMPQLDTKYVEGKDHFFDFTCVNLTVDDSALCTVSSLNFISNRFCKCKQKQGINKPILPKANWYKQELSSHASHQRYNEMTLN